MWNDWPKTNRKPILPKVGAEKIKNTGGYKGILLDHNFYTIDHTVDPQAFWLGGGELKMVKYERQYWYDVSLSLKDVLMLLRRPDNILHFIFW